MKNITDKLIQFLDTELKKDLNLEKELELNLKKIKRILLQK